MPDLTFSEIPIERNVLGKTASSETWLDGQVVSKAEAAGGASTRTSTWPIRATWKSLG